MKTEKIDVLLGLQWGDEGKGKVVDVLTPRYDVVARFQGGPNAGHTLIFDDKKFVLKSIPSGVFQGNKQNIIGNGMVLDAALFKAEAESLEAGGGVLPEQEVARAFIGGEGQALYGCAHLAEAGQELVVGVELQALDRVGQVQRQ